MMQKILDYTVPLNDISSKIHEKVLWPCFEHTVSITGLPSLSGNVFEELILRLLAVCDIKNPQQLSFDTGLEEDFICFLLDRLIQKNLISEDLSITTEGQAKLDEEKIPEPQLFCIYTDAISGKLISTIELSEERKFLIYSEGNIDYKDNYDDEGNIKPKRFYYTQINSTAGNEALEQRPMYVFRQKYEAKDISIPEVDDVIRILKKTHTISEEDNENGVTIQIDKSNPKFVYRVIDIILQEGNSRDFFASDGKGNLSPFYTNVLNSELDEKDEFTVSSLRTRLEKNILTKAQISDRQKEILNPVLFKIQKKAELIKKAKVELDKYEKNEIVQSSDSDKKLAQIKVNLIYDLYSFIEWAIFYKCTHDELPITLVLNKFKNLVGSCSINQGIVQRYLLRVAKKVGFIISEDNESFFLIKIGSINHTVKDDPEMFAICSIALAASEDNDNYWFSKFGLLCPDFFDKICQFKKMRDEARHKNDTTHSSKEILEYYDLVQKLFIELFGNDAEDFEKEELENSIKNQNELNNSIFQMENHLGFALKNSLPENLFIDIENIERYSLDSKSINPAIVISYDQLLEACFELLKADLSKVQGDYREKYKTAWHKDGNELFDVIRDSKISREVSGISVSMQAAFIAWISLEDINILRDFASQFPDILEMAHNVALMRVHGEIPEYEKILAVHGLLTDVADGQAIKEKASEILLRYKELCIKIIKYLGANGYFEQ